MSYDTRLSPEIGPPEPLMGGRQAWRGLVGLLCLALVLVTPTNGLCHRGAHDFTLVHPIFQHQHDPHAAHRDADASVSVDGDFQPRVAQSPWIAPAGSFGSFVGEAVAGLLAARLHDLLMLLVAATVLVLARQLRHQSWAAVPTGPPR